MANEVQAITVNLPATADDVIIFKTSSVGGAVTLVDAYAINHATTSGTATFTLELHKRSTAGTVIQGTIGSLGGTADHWTDTLPKRFPVSDTYDVIDDGECVSVEWAAVDGGSPTRGVVVLHYVQGMA